jgi:nucleoside permease NupC
MGRLTGVLGIFAILLFGFLFSTNRKAIRTRPLVDRWAGVVTPPARSIKR